LNRTSSEIPPPPLRIQESRCTCLAPDTEVDASGAGYAVLVIDTEELLGEN